MTFRRFIIADPGLTSQVGHHFGYSHAVAEAAAQRGLAPLVLAGRAFAGVPHSGAIPLHPVFAASYQGQGRGGAMRRLVYGATSYLPGPVARWAPEPLRLVRRWRDRYAPADGFARELTHALLQAEAGPSDIVLLHSVSAANLHGLLETPAPDTLGRLLIVLRRTPSEMDRDDAACEPILALLPKLAGRFGAALTLFADTEALAAEFTMGTGLPVSPVPLPVVVPDYVPRPRNGIPKVVFSGGARLEKGYACLPDAVAAVAGRAHFIIHSGRIGADADPLVQKAHRTLRQLAGPAMMLIEHPLDPREYFALLASADLMLLPYDPVAYGPRSSGILAEALALGAPAIVPDGCWMADVATCGGAMVIKPGQPVGTALGNALDMLPVLTAAAIKAMTAWRAKHNPDALLAALLGCANRPRVR